MRVDEMSDDDKRRWKKLVQAVKDFLEGEEE